MTRPLRDRGAEALRRCRIGEARPLWPDLPEDTREDWRQSFDALLALGRTHLAFRVEDTRGEGWG